MPSNSLDLVMRRLNVSLEVRLQEITLPAVFEGANEVLLLDMRFLVAFEKNFLVKCFPAVLASELWLLVVDLMVFQLSMAQELLRAKFASEIADSDFGVA